ncbi:unnamed protein product [Urochloa decumbens]|uniref:Transcription repressor n=1 Tax=Urochloa decumbens TaxID=240449 RepID=A0ABC9HE29_9POAL
MSTTSRARGGGGGGRQFPVGRRRYVPVVDAGCGSGCRPRRRPSLLRLPSFSFLKPCHQLGGKAVAVPARRSGGGGEQYSCASTSTASFSSSSAATHSTGYSSAYSSDYYYVAAAATGAKQQQQAPPSPRARSPAAGKKQQVKGKKKKKRATAGQEGQEGGVGVAVEKESSDPRADFRESMVQMVVEMGLCDWDGLRGMLRRLLALNAPRHHAAILTAFAEVCTQLAGAAAAATAPPSPPSYQPSPPAYHHQYRR